MVTAVAGCSAIADFIGDQVLEEVNVFNETSQAVSGSVTVTDPGGDTALDETFDVASSDADEESNIAAYGDVWGDTGEYEISVELDTEIEGTTEASETVTIENTDDEMVGIALGNDEEDEVIAISVGESLSDFAEEDG